MLNFESGTRNNVICLGGQIFNSEEFTAVIPTPIKKTIQKLAIVWALDPFAFGFKTNGLRCSQLPTLIGVCNFKEKQGSSNKVK